MEQQREYFRVRCQAVVNIESIAASDEDETLDAFQAGEGDGVVELTILLRPQVACQPYADQQADQHAQQFVQ